MADKQIDEVFEAANRCAYVLYGREPEIQGAILAELLSRWLAGHFGETPEHTKALRDSLLGVHIKSVIELIPESEKEILEGERKSGRMQ